MEEIVICVVALIVVAVAVYLIARVVETRGPLARRVAVRVAELQKDASTVFPKIVIQNT